MAKLPLEGIRIVECTNLLAGPYCTMILSDWGAEVIRVETTKTLQGSPRGQYAHVPPDLLAQARANGSGVGFTFPDWDPGERPFNRAPSFTSTGRNKKSVTIDLKQPEGHDILGRLVKTADVFIENNVPETLDHLNISYEWLKSIKPDIVMIRMPGYGTTGPYRDYRATGGHINGVIGHTYIMGHPDEDLSRRGSTVAADAANGAAGVFNIMAALWYRNRTGKGQLIESTLAENIIPFMAESILDYTMNGRIRETIGNHDRRKAPHGVYRCKGEDTWMTIAVQNDEEWQGLCMAMGNTELALDPRFTDSFSRWKNQDELDPIIREWTMQQDHREAFLLLQRHGVTAGAVLHPGELLEDPHMEARGFYQKLEHPEMRTFKYTGPLWSMSKTTVKLRSAPPLLGQHNEYVYKGILGLSDEEYARLEQAGHIGMDMAPGVP